MPKPLLNLSALVAQCNNGRAKIHCCPNLPTGEEKAGRTPNILNEHSWERQAISLKRRTNSTGVIDALADLFILRRVPPLTRRIVILSSVIRTDKPRLDAKNSLNAGLALICQWFLENSWRTRVTTGAPIQSRLVAGYSPVSASSTR